MALGLASEFKPLKPFEIEEIKEKGEIGTPLFSYPMS
jgi:hypothetical protein